MKATASKKNGGFTLLEALFAIILIGLGVVSLVTASGAFTAANSSGLDISTAEFLIEEMREMTATVPFDNLTAMNGQTYNPPVDLSQTALADFGAYTQQLTVQHVNPSDLTTPQAGSDFIRVEVSVVKNGTLINTASWIRANVN